MLLLSDSAINTTFLDDCVNHTTVKWSRDTSTSQGDKEATADDGGTAKILATGGNLWMDSNFFSSELKEMKNHLYARWK